MTLIKSISGIRGTIGGRVDDNLTPIDSVKFATAYGTWLKQNSKSEKHSVVVGRDARISGSMIQNLVMNTLIGQGIHVIDIGLSTTPTVEIAVPKENAQGGIILSASHNPKEWNALKLLNEKGEFLNENDGKKILSIIDRNAFEFTDVDNLGQIVRKDNYIDIHINDVIRLPVINNKAIEKAKFKVVVDGVNSTGGIAVPLLLKTLGVDVIELYCEPNGHFPHNPEPLKEHLTDLSKAVVDNTADFGIVVDPDVDRLAFIDERGEMFGEEYTLVACADYILSKKQGNTVSNMSSTRALKNITEKYGGNYEASAVGEVNVVEKMKEINAIIGGEGNGGIIYPELHYGRDAMVGIAIFLSLLAEKNMSVSALKRDYPLYFMSKKKIVLTPNLNIDDIFKGVEARYKNENINDIDGLKIDFKECWVHLRKSNTEPIIRVYTEAFTQDEADNLANKFIKEIEGYNVISF